MAEGKGSDRRTGAPGEAPRDENDAAASPSSSDASEASEASLAEAETRILDEEGAAELATQLALGDPEAPTVLAADEVGSGAGGADAPRIPVEPGSARSGPSQERPDDDDRTQLVTRGPGATQDPTPGEPAEATGSGRLKPTRVLDPSIPPADSAAGARLPDTRVLDEGDPDKTAPPPVGEAIGAARSPEAPDAPAAAAAASAAAAARSAEADRGLAPGTVLFGEYEIVNVLGVGGMGEVYRAKHRRLGEHRAIKVMHAELSKKKGASEFFYREAKALLAVRHPAVAHCHDMLSDDAGRVYLIMEMIEGIPLSKKMNDGPLSPDEVALLGARVAHGLAAAHRKGVIHRDVSPDNIVLPNGRVQEAKIIDFGIAKLLEEGEGTIVDGFKGKLSYASPEQLGFFGGKIDGRSDFYSLGLVLVAAALGRPMGMGTTVVEAVDARRSFETLPDEIPIGLRSAIQPLLALDPDDRPRYVDRLFVVPGGREGASDTGPISTGRIERSGGEKSDAKIGKSRLAGGAAAAAFVLAAGLYLGMTERLGMTESDSLPGETKPMVAGVVAGADGAASANTTSAQAGPTNAETVGTPGANGSEASISPAAPGPVEFVPGVEESKPAVVAKRPEAPKPRRVTARDRLKIIGLIGNARRALEENRLMSPASDNAYDRYVQVLELDPSDQRAVAGLRQIASRYVSMADRAVDQGDLEQARTFVERARRADRDYAGIAAIESRLRN